MKDKGMCVDIKNNTTYQLISPIPIWVQQDISSNIKMSTICELRVKKDGKEDEKTTEQKFRWDEECHLLAANENGFVSCYWYDADGERTVKPSGENEEIYVNSEFSGGRTNTAKFSLYVSPYLVAGQGGKYTKHIYVGSQRIISKLGALASYGADPRRIPYRRQ